MKKITIITGHYGSGKTNLAVNLALRLADAGEKVTIVDFDIVNPYFRTADFAKLFEERGHSDSDCSSDFQRSGFCPGQRVFGNPDGSRNSNNRSYSM